MSQNVSAHRAELRANGNLVALGDSGFAEEDAELLDVRGQIGVGEGLALKVAEGFLVPSLVNGVFQFFQIMFHCSLSLIGKKRRVSAFSISDFIILLQK